MWYNEKLLEKNRVSYEKKQIIIEKVTAEAKKQKKNALHFYTRA